MSGAVSFHQIEVVIGHYALLVVSGNVRQHALAPLRLRYAADGLVDPVDHLPREQIFDVQVMPLPVGLG